MDADVLQQFISLTGADTDFAISFLETNGWDLEHCVNLYLEGGVAGGSPPAPRVSAGGAMASEDIPYIPPENMEDQVRAPIQPKSETLVEDDVAYNQFLAHRRAMRSGFQSNSPANVFEMFRDFKNEAYNPVGAGAATEGSKKLKTLADLFRPPMELIEPGPFEQVKAKAAGREKWMLVNIQVITEFDCQRLNRDTWSDPAVKAVVSTHFVLWQVLQNSEDGDRYCRFYPVTGMPHIAILDSRTGERLLVSEGFVDAPAFLQLLNNFLSTHSFWGISSPSPPHPNHTHIEIPLIPSSPPRSTSPKRIGDISEEEELQAAIAASLSQDDHHTTSDDDNHKKETHTPVPHPSFPNTNATQTAPITTTTTNIPSSATTTEHVHTTNTTPAPTQHQVEVDEEANKAILAAHSDPSAELTCTIQVRAPSGLIKGHFRPNDKASLVRDYVAAHLRTSFTLFTTFPKRAIEGDVLDQTLKELDLVPRAALNCEQK